MKILTFGELMLRLKTPEHLKILQADTFEASYGGAEANVAVSLATLGNDVSYVTKVPEHQVGQAAINEIRRFGVDTTRVLLGRRPRRYLLFLKREPTSDRRAWFMTAPTARSRWQKRRSLTGKNCSRAWISFISPVSRRPSAARSKRRWRSLLCSAKRKKFRWYVISTTAEKMWSAKDAQRVMRRLMSYVDVCIANDEDFESSLGIPAYDGDISRGIEQIESYKEGMLEIQKQFPNCKAVASVLRNLYTVEDGDWMGIYLKDGKFYESPVHKVHSFEAVGAGDAFGAGLIHAMAHDFAPQRTIDFAISASVLKLMIQHDANVVSEKEIEQIMKQGGQICRDRGNKKIPRVHTGQQEE